MRKWLRAFWRVISAPFRLILWIIRRIVRWFRETTQRIVDFLEMEPDDSPVPDAFAKALENPIEILYHLDALRKHLLRAVVVLLITTGLSFAFASQILEILASPLENGIETLQAIDVTEPIGVFMRVSLISGFALALPYIILELWLFIAPGLRRRARLLGLLAIPAISVFFVAGMAFAYYIMLPTALPFLLNFMDISVMPRPSTYIRFVTGLIFWIGVAFEFPLVIYLLAAMGLVRAGTLLRQARLAVVILAIMAAAITPTIDPVNMFLVWGPLVVLYFLGIGLAFIAQGRRSLEGST